MSENVIPYLILQRNSKLQLAHESHTFVNAGNTHRQGICVELKWEPRGPSQYKDVVLPV